MGTDIITYSPEKSGQDFLLLSVKECYRKDVASLMQRFETLFT